MRQIIAARPNSLVSSHAHIRYGSLQRPLRDYRGSDVRCISYARHLRMRGLPAQTGDVPALGVFDQDASRLIQSD